MSQLRQCLTDGMVMGTYIQAGEIRIELEVPGQEWSEKAKEEITIRLHDAIEYALAPYWKESENK